MATTPLILNVGVNASSTTIDALKAGMDIGKTEGYIGARFSAGISGQGATGTFDSTYVVQAVQYAQSIGLDRVIILLNLAPKADGTAVKAANGGNALDPKTLSTVNAVNDITVGYWQQTVDACRAVAPDVFLWWEWLNEGCRGGNQQPINNDGTFTTFSLNTHGTAILDGEYPQETADVLDYISSRVNFHACKTIALTLEGSGTASAQREVDSIIGTSFQNVINRADYIGTNRYGEQPASPYSDVACMAAFHTRLGEQLARMAANALIGIKGVVLGEFGFDIARLIVGVSPNEVRQDLARQVMIEAGLISGGFFCCFDTTGNTASGQPYHFKAYALDGTALWGDRVGPNAPRRTSSWVTTSTSFTVSDDTSSGGSRAWSNPTNAQTDNGTFATVTVPDVEFSHWLKAKTPIGLSFPAGAVPEWILVQARVKANHQVPTALIEENITIAGLKLLQGGVIGGTDLLSLAKNIDEEWPTASTLISFRINVSESGHTWPVSAFDSQSGFAISAQGADQQVLGMTASIDFLSWTVGGSLAAAIDQGAFFEFF